MSAEPKAAGQALCRFWHNTGRRGLVQGAVMPVRVVNVRAGWTAEMVSRRRSRPGNLTKPDPIIEPHRSSPQLTGQEDCRNPHVPLISEKSGNGYFAMLIRNLTGSRIRPRNQRFVIPVCCGMRAQGGSVQVAISVQRTRWRALPIQGNRRRAKSPSGLTAAFILTEHPPTESFT